MASTLVLTFIADDRPGLVGLLSETVAGHGGNWLESRMAHLAEKFAGIARVEIAADKEPGLRDALLGLASQGVQVTAEAGDKAGPPPWGRLLEMELIGPDQPGIVRDITHCLAENGVSVEEMETEIRDAPMGGGTLFYASARLRVPDRLEAGDVNTCLETLAGPLMVDISIRTGQ